MKCIVALFAFMAVASANIAHVPGFYSGYAYSAYPYAAAYAAPVAQAYAAPLAYTAPVAAVPSGYVAQTRGSLHVAPHPEGPFTASHHINTAPAPGTF